MNTSPNVQTDLNTKYKASTKKLYNLQRRPVADPLPKANTMEGTSNNNPRGTSPIITSTSNPSRPREERK